MPLTPEEQAQLAALEAKVAALTPPASTSVLNLNAPDSGTAGQLRNVIALVGGVLVTAGYLKSDQLSPLTGDLIQLVGILAPIAAGVWSYFNKLRVTKTIVAANQQPAAPTGTPVANIVASATAHAAAAPSIETNPAGVSVVKQP